MSFLQSTFISDARQETSTAGTRISDTNFILYMNRAIKYFTTNYKIPTTERKADFLAFGNVYEYPLPSDFVGIIPPRRPYELHSPDFLHETSRSFVRWLHGKKTAIAHDRETAFLQANTDDGISVAIHSCNTLDENGTWSISGDGSALAQDLQIYTEGTGALKFTITGSGGTTTLVNSDFSALDITSYLTAGWLFLDLQTPSANTTAVTSVRVRIGSDASNYYEVTNTIRHRGNSILNGWGLIGFDMSGKTTTGTPDDDAINYCQVVITHAADSSMDGTYRMDNIFLSLPTYYELPYYSKNNVKTSGDVYQEAVTSTGDTILCPVEFNEAFYYKALELAAAERLSKSGLAEYFRGELRPKEMALKAKFPTQERLVQNNWYKKRRRF